MVDTFLRINFLVGGKIINKPKKSVAKPGIIRSMDAKAKADIIEKINKEGKDDYKYREYIGSDGSLVLYTVQSTVQHDMIHIHDTNMLFKFLCATVPYY